jgi:hypothetical protein
MKKSETKIRVYADWDFLEEAQIMGFLTSQRVRGKEIFSWSKKNRFNPPDTYNWLNIIFANFSFWYLPSRCP